MAPLRKRPRTAEMPETDVGGLPVPDVDAKSYPYVGGLPEPLPDGRCFRQLRCVEDAELTDPPVAPREFSPFTKQRLGAPWSGH